MSQGPPPYSKNAPPSAGFHVPENQPMPMPMPMPMPSSQTVVTDAVPVVITTQQQPASPSSHVVIVQQPPAAAASTTIVVHEILPPAPTLVTCPNCQRRVTTRVEYKPTFRTHMWAAIMCVFVLWPCCLIPYFIKGCKRANHFCPKCRGFIGSAF